MEMKAFLSINIKWKPVTKLMTLNFKLMRIKNILKRLWQNVFVSPKVETCVHIKHKKTPHHARRKIDGYCLFSKWFKVLYFVKLRIYNQKCVIETS